MSKHYEQDKLQERYGKSEKGNFFVQETVGVPHPYCITPRHVSVASDSFCGILGPDAIAHAERQGAHCGIRGCNLSFNKHEQALLLLCKDELHESPGKTNPELHAYLMQIKGLCEEDGFAGFAFVKE